MTPCDSVFDAIFQGLRFNQTKGARKMADKLRTVIIKSGKYEEEIQLTQAQYDEYMRPWWQQKKREQRNRDVMGERGYSVESYDVWKDKYNNESSSRQLIESVDELVEKKIEMEILAKALNTLLPDEHEMAMTVLTGEVPLAEYARRHNVKRTTMSDKKKKLINKLRDFFISNGFEN